MPEASSSPNSRSPSGDDNGFALLLGEHHYDLIPLAFLLDFVGEYLLRRSDVDPSEIAVPIELYGPANLSHFIKLYGSPGFFSWLFEKVFLRGNERPGTPRVRLDGERYRTLARLLDCKVSVIPVDTEGRLVRTMPRFWQTRRMMDSRDKAMAHEISRARDSGKKYMIMSVGASHVDDGILSSAIRCFPKENLAQMLKKAGINCHVRYPVRFQSRADVTTYYKKDDRYRRVALHGLEWHSLLPKKGRLFLGGWDIYSSFENRMKICDDLFCELTGKKSIYEIPRLTRSELNARLRIPAKPIPVVSRNNVPNLSRDHLLQDGNSPSEPMTPSCKLPNLPTPSKQSIPTRPNLPPKKPRSSNHCVLPALAAQRSRNDGTDHRARLDLKSILDSTEGVLPSLRPPKACITTPSSRRVVNRSNNRTPALHTVGSGNSVIRVRPAPRAGTSSRYSGPNGNLRKHSSSGRKGTGSLTVIGL